MAAQTTILEEILQSFNSAIWEETFQQTGVNDD